MPTALVDLSKPAFRFGMAEIQVGAAAHRIDVKVAADQASYPVRGKAQVTISATLPDGKPAAHAEVALAAVDEALLELMPNSSWNLLGAMLQRRAWGVQTSSASALASPGQCARSAHGYREATDPPFERRRSGARWISKGTCLHGRERLNEHP